MNAIQLVEQHVSAVALKPVQEAVMPHVVAVLVHVLVHVQGGVLLVVFQHVKHNVSMEVLIK